MRSIDRVLVVVDDAPGRFGPQLGEALFHALPTPQRELAIGSSANCPASHISGLDADHRHQMSFPIPVVQLREVGGERFQRRERTAAGEALFYQARGFPACSQSARRTAFGSARGRQRRRTRSSSRRSRPETLVVDPKAGPRSQLLTGYGGSRRPGAQR